MLREIFFLSRVFWIACAVATLSPIPSFAQQSPSAADFLPATTAIYLHIEKPAELIETIESHPVVEQVLELRQVKDLMATPQFAMATVGRSFLEAQLKEPLLEALKENVTNGFWIGVDTETNESFLSLTPRKKIA